ncbi:MAG: hypothetical protein KAY32_15745 [Candidatus Eisenbacteria sp.]|nr:hypothetical protein [Candidatus Eisenbacteria bacterium]
MTARSRAIVFPVAAAILVMLGLGGAAPARATIELWSDGFEDGNHSCWWFDAVVGASYGVDNTIANTGSNSFKVTGSALWDEGLFAHSRTIPIDLTHDYTVQFAFRYETFHWDRFLIFGHIRLLIDTPAYPMRYDPSGTNNFTPINDVDFGEYLAADTWGWVTIHCRPRVREYSVFLDAAHVATVTYQAGVTASTNLWFEDNHAFTNHMTAWYDDFSIRGFLPPQSYAVPGLDWDSENGCTSWEHPPTVPFHGQYTTATALSEPCCPARKNGRCAVACLQMVFDRCGDALPNPAVTPPGPQEEIEAGANTNDRVNGRDSLWLGTVVDDLRRAGHFSHATQALTLIRQGCPPQGYARAPGAWGYSWRDIGYAAFDSIWTEVAPADTVDEAGTDRPEELETFLGSGYPVIAFINPPEDYCEQIFEDAYDPESVDFTNCPPEETTTGHAVLIIGYDNYGNYGPNTSAQPAFQIHDPAVCQGGWIPMQYFWDQVWTSKRFVLVAPWELILLSPPTWDYSTAFDATLLVSYTGPAPLNGLFPVTDVQAELTLTQIGFDGGEQVHAVAGIAQSGDWGFSTWDLMGPGWQGAPVTGTIAGTAWGTLSPSVSSHSYADYADEIGGERSDQKQITQGQPPGINNPGHADWPYSDRWWQGGGGGGGGSSLESYDVGGGTVEVYVTVRNFGMNTLPSGDPVHVYCGDPSVAEYAPGDLYLGSLTLPVLGFGQSARLGPLPVTLPPINSFGEPHFMLFTAIDYPPDPPESDWPQAENNYGTLAEFHLEGGVGEPLGLQFQLVNPEPTAMEVRLEIEKEEYARFWDAELSLPVGVAIPLGPGEIQVAQITVTPTAHDTLGYVHVDCFLQLPGGGLVRQTGGITLAVHVPEAAGLEASPSYASPVMLRPSRPNPFGRVTRLQYELPRPGRVTLSICDVAGRVVRLLAVGERARGTHEIVWEGRQESGAMAPAGIYFCRLEFENLPWVTKKLVRLR